MIAAMPGEAPTASNPRAEGRAPALCGRDLSVFRGERRARHAALRFRGPGLLAGGLLATVLALAPVLEQHARAQDDWSITRPGGPRPGARRPGGRSPGHGRTATRSVQATTIPAPAAPNAEAARRDAMIARYRRVLDAEPTAAFALQRLFDLARERDGGLDGLVAAIAAEPPGYASRMLLGALARAQGRGADAQRLYREAGALRPEAHEPLAALAALVRADGDAQAARALYREALARARTDAARQELVRESATLAMDSGDFEAARADYDALVPTRGASVFLSTEYARALAARGEHSRAAAELERVRGRLRGDGRVLGPILRDLGRAYRDAGDPERALAILNDALRSTREGGLRRELFELLTDTYRRAGRLPELAETLRADARTDAIAARAAIEDELGHDAEALVAYRRVLGANPRDVDTRLRVVQVLSRSGQLDAVIAEYRALLRAVPGEPRFVVELAQLLVQQGRRDEARRLAAETSRRHPREARVHRALAELYARWREDALAAAEVALLARLEPNDPTHLVALGTQQLEAGDADAARATWRRILTVEPDSVRAHATLGGLYADHDFLPDAASAYEESLRLAPTDIDALRGLAGVRERLGESARAAELWERVLAASPDRAERREARQRIVAAWGRTRELPRRLAELERAFRAEPPDLEAGRFLAEAWLRATPTRNADAERILERLVALAPGDVESLVALERLRAARGDLAGALAVLERLVEADARRAAAYLQRMAEHALALYRDDEAIAYARRAAERNPDDAAGHRRLGDLFRARQDPTHAVAAYRRAIELDARLFPTYFELAELHLAAGRPAEADALYRRVLRASPDDELVARAARASIQIHLGAGTLESLEHELLALALASPQRPVLRRLVVELYQALVEPLAVAARRPGPAAEAARTALERIGARALKPLLEALADADPTQRGAAVTLLAETRNPNALGPLLALAESEADIALRARALVAVGALGPVAVGAASRLAAIAGGPEARLRDAAAWALASTATRAQSGLLRGLTSHGDPAVRAFAVIGLGVARDGESRDGLEALLARDPSLDVKAAAAWSLGRLARPESVAPLVAALQSPAGLVARSAAVALGGLREPRAQAALAQALFGADAATRGASAAALAGGRASPAGALPVPSLPISTRAYLARVVDASAALGDAPVALGALVDALVEGARGGLSGPLEQVRGALDALGTAPGARLGAGALTARFDAWSAPAQREADAALALVAQGVLPDLLGVARHPDAAVRASAVAVLGRIDGAEARATVAAALLDDAAEVRRSALEVVSRLEGDAALAEVARIARVDGEWAMRARAARALGRFAGAPSACEGLEAALRVDDYAFVREAAATALAGAGCLGAGRALRDAAAGDPEPRVREAAATALGSPSPP